MRHMVATIKNFVDTRLMAVCRWDDCMIDEKMSDGDSVMVRIRCIAKAPKIDNGEVIESGRRGGTYSLRVESPNSKPPLGKVKFTDDDDVGGVEDVIGDNAWNKIAEFIHEKERRVRDIGTMAPIPVPGPRSVRNVERLASEMREKPPEQPREFIGTMVRFYPAPYDFSAGREFFPAMVVGTNSDGTVNLCVFPDGGEPFHRQRVTPRDDLTRNNCWEPLEVAAAVDSKAISDLEQSVVSLQGEIKSLRDLIHSQNRVINTLTDQVAQSTGKRPAKKRAA